mmetsp:Transcript_15612/g.23118  ORF Transcript_15612/g.23118 Transcript_15612/m.23118 type:complete len:782 (-) Transcript_15612:38-2383(-)
MSIATTFKSLCSLSTLASLLTILYMYSAVSNLYNLMHPLRSIDIENEYNANELIHPLWSKKKGAAPMSLSVYLSAEERFDVGYIVQNEEEDYNADKDRNSRSVLLWEEAFISSPSLSKSFILTTTNSKKSGNEENDDASFRYAEEWIKQAEEEAAEATGGGLLAAVSSSSSGGIESTSVLLSLYNSVVKTLNKITSFFSSSETTTSSSESSSVTKEEKQPNIISLDPQGPIWSTFISNATALYIHVLITHNTKPLHSDTRYGASQLLRQTDANNDLLPVGSISLLKYTPPHHIAKPTRFLYLDLLYLCRKYMLADNAQEYPPWDTHYSDPVQHQHYQTAKLHQEEGIAHPYWKPEVSVKLVEDTQVYPIDLAHVSGMEFKRVHKTAQHPTGLAYLPSLYVQEIGLTSEKYIHVNDTVTSVPLRIGFDRSIDEDGSDGGLTPARWRLLRHFTTALEAQSELGFDQSDIDDLRRLIADTNVTLLGITILASVLHLLFEFLTFKNDVQFWQYNSDLTGLSVRSLFLDMMSQVVILMYLVEKESSLLMIVPTGFGVLIALWKCQRGAGFRFVKYQKKNDEEGSVGILNKVLRNVLGFEIVATRLQTTAQKEKKTEGKQQQGEEKSRNKADDLATLSLEMDKYATNTLGKFVIVPMVLSYTFYTLIYYPHSSWYSWIIDSASSAVYGIGFALMTPQLFINYKLKSVAHLPWRVLCYRFLNTFIDDLFAFIIRMPTLARISCFRDDIVFVIYLYQRYLYPVDTSRPVEGGGSNDDEADKSNMKKKVE